MVNLNSIKSCIGILTGVTSLIIGSLQIAKATKELKKIDEEEEKKTQENTDAIEVTDYTEV